MSSRVITVGAVSSVLLTATLAPSAMAAAPPAHTFEVLSAVETYSVTASEGCVSGHRAFTVVPGASGRAAVRRR
jgi:hypothetical protein